MAKQSLEQNYLNDDICQKIQNSTLSICQKAAFLTMQNDKINVWLINCNALLPTWAQINMSLEEASTHPPTFLRKT